MYIKKISLHEIKIRFGESGKRERKEEGKCNKEKERKKSTAKTNIMLKKQDVCLCIGVISK